MSIDEALFYHAHQRFLEAAGDFVAILTPAGDLLHVNEAGQFLLGADAATLTQCNLLDLLAPAQRDAFSSEALPAALQGSPWRGEVTLVWDGLETPVWLTLVGHPDDAAQVSLLGAIAYDVTDRKWTEASLRESEIRFRGAFDNTSAGMALVDLDGRFLLTNAAMNQLLRAAPEELLQQNLLDMLYPDDAEHNRLQLEQLVRGESSSHIAEVRLIDRAGRDFWTETSVTAIQDFDGRLLYFMVQTRDISKRKTGEEELQLINAIGQALHRSLNVADVATETVNAIVRFTDAPTAVFFLLDEAAQVLRLAASYGVSDDARRVGSVLPLKSSLSGLAVRERDVVLSEHVATDERMEPTVQKALVAQGCKTAISMPILHDEQILGVVNLLFLVERPSLAAKRDTLRAISRTIGLALANALRLSQLEVEIEDRQKAVHALAAGEQLARDQLAFSRAIAQATTTEQVVTAVSDKAAFHPQIGVLLFFRELTDGESTLVLKTQNPSNSQLTLLPANARLKQQDMPRLLQPDAPFVTPNVGQDPEVGRAAVRLARLAGIVSWAAFPLTAGGSWFGTLMFASPKEAIFTEQQLASFQSLAEQSAIALNAIRLAAETQSSLERRSRAVTLATRIAQEIAAAADLDELYRQIVDQVQEQFGYYHTQLLRYDPGLDTVALVRGYGAVGREMLALHHSVPMGVGIIGVTALTGQSVLRSNVRTDKDWQANTLLPRTRGELAVPIKLRDEVLGVLDVQSDAADALTEEDQLILEGLCGQIAVAIESTRLRQEMEASLRELNTLQRLMSREGWEAYRASKAHVPGYIFDQAGVQILDPQANTVPQRGRMLTDTMRGRLTQAPLTVRGEPIGVLALEDSGDAPLSREDQVFLESVAQQVAEALEVARLVEQTQDALAEQERLTAQLETVAQVSMAASTILDVDTLLQTVVDLTKSSFGLYHAAVYLVDDQLPEKLVLKAGAGNVGRLLTLEGHVVHLNDGTLVARTARTAETLIENEVRHVIDFKPQPLLPNTRAEMAVPLNVGNKLVGILDLHADKSGFFTEDDVTIQRTLASQVAVAIENAKLYAEQVETTVKLRQVDQLKSEFLASMSHELRTPLNSIIGFADVLLEGLDGELNERMEEDVRLIRDSGTHLRALIGDILDMSKIEAGRMELRYETVDMRQMAQDIISTAQPLAQEKNLALHLELGDAVGDVELDRTRIRQVLWNIMGNAIKFTEKGSVTLRMIEEDGYLRVNIRDTGIGIRAEDVAIVFEQFRQIDGNLNRRASGTGLGMPISKKLIELHGGRIWVDSVVGEGSTFSFTIPLSRSRRPVTGPLG